MNRLNFFAWLRWWAVVILFVSASSAFYGLLAMTVVAEFAPNISENNRLIFVFFPVTAVMALFMWAKRHKIFGAKPD